MRRRAVAALLAAMMAVTMSACGNKGEEESANNLADGYEAPEFSSGESAEVLAEADEQSVSDTEGDVSGERNKGRILTDADKGQDRADQDEGQDRTDQDEGQDRADTDADGEKDRADADAEKSYAGTEDTEYQIDVEEYESGLDNTTIEYPQISGWDEELQDRWNDTFYNMAKNACKDAGINDSIEMKVKVMTQNGEVCSIVVTENDYWEGAAHPYGYCTTYNIDIKTGEKLTLSDFADTDEIADTLLNTEDYTIQTEDVTLEDIFLFAGMAGKMPKKDVLSRNLAAFDLPYEERSDNAGDILLNGSSFLEDGKTVLCMEVNHAMGDYVWVTVP